MKASLLLPAVVASLALLNKLLDCLLLPLALDEGMRNRVSWSGNRRPAFRSDGRYEVGTIGVVVELATKGTCEVASDLYCLGLLMACCPSWSAGFGSGGAGGGDGEATALSVSMP